MRTIIVEVSPLWELKYTGVPNVVYEYVSRAIKSNSIDHVFTICGHIIPKGIIHSAINSRSGACIREFLGGKLTLSSEYASVVSRHKTPFLFTNTCNISSLGNPKSQIVYDLSYFSFAEYHTAPNIAHMAHQFEENILSNSITFCISDSTRAELEALFGFSSELTTVTIPLGPSILPEDQLQSLELSVNSDSLFRILARESRYFLFISTIEPRKNLDLIFSALSEDPELFENHSLVVVGRDGWNTSWQDLIQKYNLESLVHRNFIIRLPYVTESQKYLLLKNCRALIYPSCYEGFGLPVLEALLS